MESTTPRMIRDSRIPAAPPRTSVMFSTLAPSSDMIDLRGYRTPRVIRGSRIAAATPRTSVMFSTLGPSSDMIDLRGYRIRASRPESRFLIASERQRAHARQRADEREGGEEMSTGTVGRTSGTEPPFLSAQEAVALLNVSTLWV